MGKKEKEDREYPRVGRDLVMLTLERGLSDSPSRELIAH
jgi:hypothetical protein